MISEEKKLSDKVKLLQERVARLTDKLKDQIEINQFLRKVNGELNEELEKKKKKNENSVQRG